MKYLKVLLLSILVISLGFVSNKVLIEHPTVHNINIVGEVNPTMLKNVEAELATTKAGDIVYYHIDSPGGYVIVGEQIKRDMVANRGRLVQIASLEGDADSMAWDILITCDFVKIVKYVRCVVHASYMANGDYTVIIHRGFGLDEDHERQKFEYKYWITKDEEDQIFDANHSNHWLDYYMLQPVFISRTLDPRTRLEMYTEAVGASINDLSLIIRIERVIDKYELNGVFNTIKIGVMMI